MNNFGVVELASAKTTRAPGWAYVPDTGANLAAAALQPANRKRAVRTQAGGGLTSSDLSARQEAKLRKELEALDRDGSRDANIPVPHKAGRVQSKGTPNVRKILQSQKTFANHLDDFQALQALAENNPSQARAPGGAGASSNAGASAATIAAGKKAGAAAAAAKKAEAAKGSSAKSRRDRAAAAAAAEQDTDMPDAPEPSSTESESSLLTPYAKPPPASHPGDADPLLASRVPPLPTDAELRELLAAPPLTYLEARGAWPDPGDDEAPRYPPRRFCEVCGYWGRVRCMKCGARVCALDCLETHREECVTRYGL